MWVEVSTMLVNSYMRLTLTIPYSPSIPVKNDPWVQDIINVKLGNTFRHLIVNTQCSFWIVLSAEILWSTILIMVSYVYNSNTTAITTALSPKTQHPFSSHPLYQLKCMDQFSIILHWDLCCYPSDKTLRPWYSPYIYKSMTLWRLREKKISVSQNSPP